MFALHIALCRHGYRVEILAGIAGNIGRLLLQRIQIVKRRLLRLLLFRVLKRLLKLATHTCHLLFADFPWATPPLFALSHPLHQRSHVFISYKYRYSLCTYNKDRAVWEKSMVAKAGSCYMLPTCFFVLLFNFCEAIFLFAARLQEREDEAADEDDKQHNLHCAERSFALHEFFLRGLV